MPAIAANVKFVIVPAASAATLASYAAQVDASLGLPFGQGTKLYTKTYADLLTSADGAQQAYRYDAITQPVIDPASALAASVLPANWFPSTGPNVVDAQPV